MSLGSRKLERQEQALEATRRRLRRLEIEAHRIRADLARLEAEYEDDVADWLSRKLRRRAPSDGVMRADLPHRDGEVAAPNSLPFSAVSSDSAPHLKPTAVAGVLDPDDKTHTRHSSRTSRQTSLPLNVAVATDGSSLGIRSLRPAQRRTYRKTAPPLVFSLAVHAVGVLLCVTFGFATIIQQSVPLFASPTDFAEDVPDELSEVKIEPSKFDDAELQNVVSETDEFNVADSLLREFEPTQFGAGAQPLGDIGQLDALPSELGTLMAGAGSPGSGRPGGEIGDAMFFGARSQGDRFVFVVDNSSSMRNGRLEAAIAELKRSVEALSPRQGFYVIFVSDQIYPMFYPQAAGDLLPATSPNKKRLAEWLPRAATASGKNRELIKAMDMAARLRPHAVFFLWDGRMDHAGVRQDVMTHMTRPNQWGFPIHTIGMGVESLDSEYNLAAIAQASGGTFRRVDVPAARGR
jgi:von Willebrand factor type A domain